MIPKKKDWKNWSSSDRVNYIALALAPISLIFTVLFSYLTWKQAADAYRLQTILFVAQNAPIIEINSVGIVQENKDRLALATVHNTGSSIAKNACVELYLNSSKDPISRICNSATGMKPVSIAQSQSVEIPIIMLINLESELGVIPDRIYVLREVGSSYECLAKRKVFEAKLVLRYADILGNEIESSYDLMFC